MRTDVLASGLDNLYAERCYDVLKTDVMSYAMTLDELEVQPQLDAWAEAGYITVIKPLVQCENMEPCIKLLKWLQPRSNQPPA